MGGYLESLKGAKREKSARFCPTGHIGRMSENLKAATTISSE